MADARAGGREPGGMGARAPRVVRRVLDPARPASRRRRRARACRSAATRGGSGPGHSGGRADEPGFAFDTELPGRELHLAGFEIDASPVSVGDFMQFVEAGGYENEAWWPADAGRWRAAATRRGPERWRRTGS